VENQSEGTVVGKFSIANPNVGDAFKYTLVDGDTASFSLSGDSLRTVASFNYEACNTYTIRVRSIDQEGLWFEKEFTITVTDLNEAPEDIALSNSRAPQNSIQASTERTTS